MQNEPQRTRSDAHTPRLIKHAGRIAALAGLAPAKRVRGRGGALKTPREGADGLAGTRAFVRELYAKVKAGAAAGRDLNAIYKETYAALKPTFGDWVIFDHCMPFDVTRAFDEATQYPDPRIWTAERDKDMWHTLEG